MPGVAALVVVAVVGLAAAVPRHCPATNGGEASACDARPTASSIARCAAAAQLAEACADRTTGLVHALYLDRAATELTKAGIAAGARNAQARRWLVHATVLDERIQDDPAASGALRASARANEEKAKKALFHR